MPKTNRRMPRNKCHGIQGLLFHKSLWTKTRAKNWLRKKGYHFDSLDVPTSKTAMYIRARQYDPPSKKLAITRTITFSKEKGIKALYNLKKKCMHMHTL